MDSRIRTILDNLYDKPISYKFTTKELNFMKKHLDTSKWKVLYCLYTNKSNKGCYVGFVIDYMSHNPRDRKAEHYSMNVICSRNLNEQELMWEYKNYGTKKRRFHCFWVNSILWVQEMDAVYGIQTPQEFIDICNEKGYNNGLQKQLIF